MQLLKPLVLGILLSACTAGQNLISVSTFTVEPEKRQAFDALVGKLADLCRRNGGPEWIAMEAYYGPRHIIRTVSYYGTMADIDTSRGLLTAAVLKGLGQEGARGFWGELNSTYESAYVELRRRHPALSHGMPEDRAGFMKLLGQSRLLWVRRNVLKSGVSGDFEESMKTLKDAMQKAGYPGPFSVSSSLTGTTTYYWVRFLKSFADLEALAKYSLSKAMGASAYREWSRKRGEMTQERDTEILRLIPQLSNPPAEVVQADPEFWKAQPPLPPPPKPRKEAAPKK